MRQVGTESCKTYEDKLKSGFFTKYMNGKGCEIGYAGYGSGAETILEGCDGYDKNTPGYNGHDIPVPDGHYDYLYASHTLEHISNPGAAVLEWHRVVRKGGYLVIVVPHRDLYEKKLKPPSRWNPDHKRFYTPGSLLIEVEAALPINTYRVEHLKDNDKGHVYTDGPDVHACWEYEIELVLRKL